MTSSKLIAVVDYGIGNLHSAHKALERVGASATLTDDHEVIRTADAVVLPGVGNFGACMNALRQRSLDGVVREAATSGRPFLGICVGMQMLFEGSEESPGVAGLGLIKGSIKWLPESVKRPQMQWNQLTIQRDDPLFDVSVGDGEWMYFVHSLSAVPTDQSTVVATVSYGAEVVAVVRSGSILATQFHPEKSSDAGLSMLARWVTCIGSNQ